MKYAIMAILLFISLSSFLVGLSMAGQNMATLFMLVGFSALFIERVMK